MYAFGMVFEKKKGAGIVGIVRTLSLLSIFVVCGFAHGTDQHVILTGSGGEVMFSHRFFEWGERLQNVVSKNSKSDVEFVHWLREPIAEKGETEIEDEISVESIEATINKAAATLEEDDTLFIYLIGHGSYFKSIPKFHIPGPDLTAEDMLSWLEPISENRVVVINAASSSAPFINTLSGENRMVCTATKSATEYNAPEFMEYFIESLEDGSADLNRDDRVSFLEACQQAAELTEAWYTAEGTISTEHALIDDNGDGQGTRLERIMDIGGDFDGFLASDVFIQNYQFPEGTPQDLIDEYIEALEQVKDFKMQKESISELEYYNQLEKILVRAARVNQQIQQFSSPAETSKT